MWSKWGVDNLDGRVIAKKPDTVLIESTYGNREHPQENVLAELAPALKRVAARGGVAVVLLGDMTQPDAPAKVVSEAVAALGGLILFAAHRRASASRPAAFEAAST